MAKPFALQTVLDLMQRRADEATQQLARLIAAEQDAKTKLQLLADYREEYARRFQASAQEGLTPQQWRNFQDFLARLDDAIAQQRDVVARSQSNTVAGQQAEGYGHPLVAPSTIRNAQGTAPGTEALGRDCRTRSIVRQDLSTGGIRRTGRAGTAFAQ